MPKVSIIIPTYNVEQYLVQCMESVTRQTLKDIEIVCVNDGSTDRSLEILKRYEKKDRRVIIVDQKNGGYGKAMNAGIDRATGEYIGIVEPDDYVSLDMYEDLYKKASDYDLDMVKADFFRFTTADNGNENFVYFHLSKEPSDYNKVFHPCEEPYALNFVMNTWSGIYRRSFLVENNIRHHETPGASFQDNGFFFQTFLFAKRAMILDRPYYRNRRDNPNSSVHSAEKVYCVNQEYDYIREILMEKPELWKRFKYMYWKKRFTNYLSTISRIGDEYKREYVHYISRELNRAREAGLIRRQKYDNDQWTKIQLLMRDPDSYVNPAGGSGGKAGSDSDSRRLQDILNSRSYKLGFALTSLPRRVKEGIKNRRNGKKK